LVNVLVIGSGGREHALSWKLSQSDKVDTVFTAPGNGGTQNNVPIDVNDLEGLADFAQKNNCFTVVGPEDPLAAGIVDKKILKFLDPLKRHLSLNQVKFGQKTS
jgi:phosphoribosylamine---glycine ligase